MSTTILILVASLTVLGERDDMLPFAFALAVGLLVASVSVPRVVVADRARRVALILVLCVFGGARTVAASGDPTRFVLGLALEMTVLGMAFAFASRYLQGLERLVSLIPEERTGYAAVLDRKSAAHHFEAELARSRRNGEPLSLVVLEREADGPDAVSDEFRSAVEQLSHGVLADLEREWIRARICDLVSDHSRRSDVVVVDSEHRLFLLSASTSGEGAAQLAGRIVREADATLGIPLVAGVAACPSDGENVDELVVAARRRARSTDEVSGAITSRPNGAPVTGPVPAVFFAGGTMPRNGSDT